MGQLELGAIVECHTDTGTLPDHGSVWPQLRECELAKAHLEP